MHQRSCEIISVSTREYVVRYVVFEEEEIFAYRLFTEVFERTI